MGTDIHLLHAGFAHGSGGALKARDDGIDRCATSGAYIPSPDRLDGSAH